MEIPEVIKPFLVSPKIFVKDLDISLIISFEAYEKEEQEKLYAMLQPAHNKLLLAKYVVNGKPFLIKLDNISVDVLNGYVDIAIPTGTVRVPLTEELLNTVDEKRSGNIWLKVKPFDVDKKQRILADIELILTPDDDIEGAKEILNELTPIEALCYVVGYHPAKEMIAVLLPRFMPLFTPYNRSVHVLTFQPPETGKTHTAKVLSEITTAYHSLNFPARTRLIGDLRFNRVGLVGIYDTIYIEEFDKLKGTRKEEFQNDYESLLTGLEQGIWQREKSGKNAMEFKKHVGFCFMGNVPDEDLLNYMNLSKYEEFYHRRLAHEILAQQLNVNLTPFIDRLSYVEILRDGVKALKYAVRIENNRFALIRQNTARSIITLIKEKVLEFDDTIVEENSRLDKAINNIYAIVKTLGVEIDDSVIPELAKGSITFYDVLIKQTKTESEKSESDEDIVTYDFDLTKIMS